MQISEVAFDGLSLPPWSLSLLIALILLGIPIALILAWAYEITPQGVRKDSAGYTESKTGLQDNQETDHSIGVWVKQTLY